MKISVIMGIYNCATTLQEALDSLYAQTFQDYEIILCDDGSSDNTYEIAKTNVNKHPNIKLIRNKLNCGLNITLNNCLKIAEGEYIARMDGDDISHPTRFEKEVKFLDEHPEYAVVSCPMIYFNEYGEFARGKAIQQPKIKDFEIDTPFCHAPCMVRKSVYNEVGGYTESKWLIRHEDYNLWTKIYAKGYKGYNLSEHLYSMRDDNKAFKRRTIKGRLNCIYSNWIAYRTLHLSSIWFFKSIVISFIKIIMPSFLYKIIHENR